MASQFVRFEYKPSSRIDDGGRSPTQSVSPASNAHTAVASSSDPAAAKDLSKAQPYVGFHFHPATNPAVPAVAKEGTVGGFRLNPLVTKELGLEEKERARIQVEIEKEIERRWVEAKEKAEVEGYTLGLNTGKREAFAAEKPRIEERLKRLDVLLNQIDTMRERIFLENEDFIMSLMSQILRQITLKEIEIDKDYLRRLVLHLVGQLNERSDIAIVISSQDAHNIQHLSEVISQKFGELKGLKIQHNAEIEAGSCRLLTKSVVLDASVGEQIKNAMKVFSEPKSDESSANDPLRKG